MSQEMSMAMGAETPVPAKRPKVVCLCGSNRFWRDYIEQNILETLAGNIVISVGGFTAKDANLPKYMQVEVTTQQKKALDELHLRKIDMADEILVLNRSGYIGESTKSELTYAMAQGKAVRWLEPTFLNYGATEGEA